MKNNTWMISEYDLDEIDPLPSYPSLSPIQVSLINKRVDSSLIINGGPCTGKTMMGMLKMRSLIQEGKKCLFVPATSLSLKYVRYGLSSMGLSGLHSASYFDVAKIHTCYDVILVDDSNRFSLDQILTLASLARHLVLFGDYDNCVKYLNDLINRIRCSVFELSTPHGLSDSFIRLIPRINSSLSYSSDRQVELPRIVRIGSFEKQCHTIMNLVESLSLEDVGVICYTRSMVKNAFSYFEHQEWAVEVFLPGKEDRIDTLDFNSRRPKLMTIASSSGIHFNTVFVIGFDASIVWKESENVIKTAVTRPKEHLFVFYEDQLPDSLANLPRSFYRNSLSDGGPVVLF